MNDYDKHTQGNLPSNTTGTNNSDKWYNSFFNAAGTVGSAWITSIAPQQVEEEKEYNAAPYLVILGVLVIGVVIYFATKKKK